MIRPELAAWCGQPPLPRSGVGHIWPYRLGGGLCQNRLDHTAFHISQPHVAARITVGQLLVIQAQKVQDGGMPVVDVNLALDRLETVVVSFAISEAAPGPPAAP